MKNFLFALAAGLIPVLATTNGVNAQTSVNPEILEAQKHEAAVKHVVKDFENTTADLARISPKAQKSFTRNFKTVGDGSWEKLSDGYSVTFRSEGISNRIFYDQHGRWTGSLKGYEEAKMPKAVRDIVKRSYYDFTITYVQEAETTDSDHKPTYIVHLEDQKTIKLVRIFDGEMQNWQEYKKN